MKKLQFIIALLPLALGITITLSNCERPEDNRERVLNQAALNNDYTDLVAKASLNGDSLITSNARIALGRVLFYDVKLSRTNAIACGSCHKQQFAFADNVKKSTGFAGNNAKRNSPAIQNLSQQHRLFWDGRADSLRQLVFMPIQDHIEMGFENVDLLPSKLGATDYYPALFNAAFGSPVITKDKIGRAMSEFIQILRSDNSKFDQVVVPFMQTDNFFFSQILPTIPGLSPSENIGFNTFINKGRCNSCHNITGGGGSVNMGHTYGGSDGDLPPTNMPTVGTNTGLDAVYSDRGVMNLTGKPIDDGRFLIPGLRNVELTAPYMHDGRFATLEDVIDFYDHGVKEHPNLAVQLRDFSGENNSVLAGLLNGLNMEFDNGGFADDGVIIQEFGQFIPANAPVVAKKLNLTPAEKKGLVDFLKTFTDKTFTSDNRLNDPFVVQ